MARVSVAHMCRSGHVEIYHNDSSHEMCPLCRCQNALREALDTWELFTSVHDKVGRQRIAELRKFLDDK